MPNWCYSTYIFYADSETGKNQLAEFYQRFVKSISADKLTSDFGREWLGNIIDEFCPQFMSVGAESTTCTFEGQDISFRGSIEDIETTLDDATQGIFEFRTETAWGPMTEMWDMILSVCQYTDIKYVYLAEESNDVIYINTDIEHRFFEEKYHLDFTFSHGPSTYEYVYEYYPYNCEEQLLNYLNELIPALKRIYAENTEAFKIPETYDPNSLVVQTSIDAAVDLITANMFETTDGMDHFFYFHTYASE